MPLVVAAAIVYNWVKSVLWEEREEQAEKREGVKEEEEPIGNKEPAENKPQNIHFVLFCRYHMGSHGAERPRIDRERKPRARWRPPIGHSARVDAERRARWIQNARWYQGQTPRVV